MKVQGIAVADVKEDKRHRRDYGDLDALAASIRDRGLLHPIIVTPDLRLVVGARRLRAVKQNGVTTIDAVIASRFEDAAEALLAERDENTCREDFTPSEAVALGAELEKLERPKAAERQAEGQKAGGRGKKKLAGKLPPSKGETRDKVGLAVGMSGKQYEKAKAVVAGGDAALIAEMDKTGKVDGAHKKMKVKERDTERREAAKRTSIADGLRVGDFRTVLADVPDNSVDLIFTDPPYDRESIPLYGDLAALGARILKPGGSLIAYAGQYLLADILPLMAAKMRLWWINACIHGGQCARMNEYGIVVKWKPMLWFVKGTRRDKEVFVDDAVSSGTREKSHHDWQQAESEATYYIDKLTIKGEIVADPFAGGGTTLVAAQRLERRWVAAEIDVAHAAEASRRIEAT